MENPNSKTSPDPTSPPLSIAQARISRNADATSNQHRLKRRLPNFMYGATFPKDNIGSGGPTYGGALEWIQKHQDYFNQTLKFIQRYPNLVEEQCMDNFWDLVQPLIYNSNLLLKYDEYIKGQFSFNEAFRLEDKFHQPLPTAAQFFKPDQETKLTDYHYPIRRVFFCYDRTCPHQQKLKHLIVDALEPFVSVRTNPTKEQAKVMKSLDVCRAICGSVFIMLVNDELLKDQVSLQLLKIAIAYKTPIFFIRESGFKIPRDITDEKINFVKLPTDIPFSPKNGKLVETVKENQPTVSSALNEDQNSSTAEEQNTEGTELYTSLAQTIRDCYANAVVFTPKMFERSVGAIYDKIASHIGVQFPGDVPRFSGDTEAVDLSRPVSAGSIQLSSRRMYRVGSARTTRSFRPSIAGANSNNSARATSAGPRILSAVPGNLKDKENERSFTEKPKSKVMNWLDGESALQ